MITSLLVLALTLPNDRADYSDRRTTNLAEKLADNFALSYDSLRNLRFCTNWNIVLIKIFATISPTVFFMKFSLLLKVLHGKSSVTVGYTVAYQSTMIFLASFLVPISNKLYSGQKVTKLSHCLSLLTISIANVCYAPTYMVYLICFIPLTVAKCIFDSTFREITASQTLGDLSIGLDTITTMTSILTPSVFGYFCDLYTHNAVKGFSIIPLAVAMLIMHFSTKKQFAKLKLN